jgi:hypothetical protein
VTAAMQQWLGKQIAQQSDLTLATDAQAQTPVSAAIVLATPSRDAAEEKSLHAQEQEIPEAQPRRQAWREP